MMGATFQKDAQQRLELKHSKAREKEKEHEIEVLKAELQAARADTEAARNRIKEVPCALMSHAVASCDGRACHGWPRRPTTACGWGSSRVRRESGMRGVPVRSRAEPRACASPRFAQLEDGHLASIIDNDVDDDDGADRVSKHHLTGV
eukprot:5641969-Prymnesium_polylepis.1